MTQDGYVGGSFSYLVNGEQWYRGYGYDDFGNRWVSADDGISDHPLMPTSQGAFSAANNRLQGSNFTYDEAGRLTKYGAWDLEHDDEGRLWKLTRNVSGQQHTTEYRYDGNGRRVMRFEPGASNPVVYVYDVEGNLMAEYGGAAETAGTYFPITDHLGSTRLVLNASGGVESRHDYVPFGEEIPASVGSRAAAGYEIPSYLRQKFTGKERDEAAHEAGFDYFLARYYSSPLGRFATPDAPFADQSAADPQSWNLYAYVRNNPLGAIDPAGRDTYLLIWTPTADGVGHAAIAVSNYKQDAKTGKMVPDGTYSYRDLWPVQEVGKSNYDKDVKSEYQKKTVTEQDMLKKDVSGGEGRSADGIVKLPTDAATDKKTLSALDSHEKSNPSYNGVKNNCSTFCSTGISTAAGTPVSGQETIKSPVPWLSDVKATTPNALWQGTTRLPGTTVVKDPGAAAKKPFKVF